ncbi:hypothetical protein NQ317_013221 [Molorchus minor]|uniref:PX domain-containing protein n=1 Tax=Molorchus minor TaxID=1323400 RepID=A0ABQ9JSA8_9CUCU|nr:hypothetical protein NQ317_013221 [Molorchus minor]
MPSDELGNEEALGSWFPLSSPPTRYSLESVMMNGIFIEDMLNSMPYTLILKKLDPARLRFSPKKSIGKKDSALVEDRRKRLQIYLRRVLAHWPELSHCNSRFLLEQHLEFFSSLDVLSIGIVPVLSFQKI